MSRLQHTSRDLLLRLVRSPRLRAALRAIGRGIQYGGRRGSVLLVRGCDRYRSGLLGFLSRALWWGALAIWAKVLHGMLDGFATGPFVEHAATWAAVGLAMCCIPLIIAAQQRIRVASLVLATAHAGLAMLLWSMGQYPDPVATGMGLPSVLSGTGPGGTNLDPRTVAPAAG
ncbi:MAG: hypothetical protein V3V08_16950 [Nannocystaceae bacterium]